MIIVLPPSETKARGGAGPALDLRKISFPELTPVRAELLADLARMPVDVGLDVLGISPRLRGEAEANREVLTAPTMPAVHRYTGVLYDALDASSLDDAALSRLAVGSALFGVIAATDPIPFYRLSGSTKLPLADGTRPTMRRRWGTAITEALSQVEGLVVDLRSGAYQQLGRVPGAVTVRVESVQEDGSRKVVSHFNKHHKGRLARVLAEADEVAVDAAGVADIARQRGLVVEEKGGDELTVVV